MAVHCGGGTVGTAAMLDAELRRIAERRPGSEDPSTQASDPDAAFKPEPTLDAVYEYAAKMHLTALCLSGGGVRSAAFCLGVLQSLARRHLLGQFDYLSTVSGGGFIGGWLQILIKESDNNIREAEKRLTDGSALRQLRGFTNYLTPEVGPFSPDTWAAIVLYIRNLLLNWTVFAPVFLLIALLPVFYRTLLACLAGFPQIATPATWQVGLVYGVLGVTSAILVIATWRSCSLIPSHRDKKDNFASTPSIAWQIIVPALIWSALLPSVVNASFRQAHLPLVHWLVPGCYGGALLIGYALAAVSREDTSIDGRRLYLQNAVRWFAATAITTGLTYLAIALTEPESLLYRASTTKLYTDGPYLLINRDTAFAVFGPLWVLGTHTLQTALYVGFRKEALLADLDREWLARLNGIQLLYAVSWTVLAFCCLVAPSWLGFVMKAPRDQWQALTIALWGSGSTLAGAAAAYIGKRAVAEIGDFAKKRSRWITWLPIVLATVFAVILFASFSSLLQWVLGNLPEWIDGLVPAELDKLLKTSWVPLLIIQIFAGLICWTLMRWFGGVNVNRFSMHATYRNRLVRAFLGSARNPCRRKKPDPFSGFDPADNIRLKSLAETVPGRTLFPVINMTLNVTASRDPSMAERRAEPFIATPLYCGSASLRLPAIGSEPAGAFVATPAYAGKENRYDDRNHNAGPHLGSLLTISGAAVSPNWGYHSSRVTAFLMTLFNFRLGVWLPNPARAGKMDLQLSKPKDSVWALMSEMVGRTTDISQAVYLSDGGHFENLGVYEMLRRRCRHILVVDAGQDGNATFEDLGNLIRKARIDLQIEIVMKPMRILPRKTLEADRVQAAAALAMAVGAIDYGNGATGKLLYVKPSFLGGIPADVRAYGMNNSAFPNDPTTDQWFTESQFESYRALGFWQMDKIEGSALSDLFISASRTAAAVKAG